LKAILEREAACLAALKELTEIVEEEFKGISIDDEWTHRKYNKYKSAIERAKKLAP